MMNSSELFVEVDFAQKKKQGENSCGDSFRSMRLRSENRLISVLSDGLGSGLKASILSSMTSQMALTFTAANHDLFDSFKIIMESLPVCDKRKISYSTFSIVDSTLFGKTRIMEQGNPDFLLMRGHTPVKVKKRIICSQKWQNRKIKISELNMEPEDRIILLSDGITLAGLETAHFPLGWRLGGCVSFVSRILKEHPRISARVLAEKIVGEAKNREFSRKPADDMTCAVLYFRTPRKLLVVSGPPFAKNKDAWIAGKLSSYSGKTAVCGGTTANIVARELNRPISTSIELPPAAVPPVSKIPGIDLVTEGILTLTKASEYLKLHRYSCPVNAAGKLCNLMLDSDIIEFQVGTRVNEAHQDPSLPVEIEIRRNIIKKIARELSEKHFKEVRIDYV